MSIEEANKVIVEFMGWKVRRDTFCIDGYYGLELHPRELALSLDALVPVWEKLELYGGFYTSSKTFIVQTREYGSRKTIEAEGLTIQEAACIATAKAIKELNE